MSTLPKGWAVATIDAVTAKPAQRIPDASENFVYVDIGSVDRETKKITASVKTSGSDAPTRARQVLNSGDVLVSMTRPNLNAVALVSDDLDGQIASTGFDVLRPLEIDPRWIFAAVRSKRFVDAMSALVQGALYPAVRPRDVRGFELPLPPVPEQKRIADKLDAVLARVDACRERLARVPSILKRFRQSVLAAATSGLLTEEWRTQHFSLRSIGPSRAFSRGHGDAVIDGETCGDRYDGLQADELLSQLAIAKEALIKNKIIKKDLAYSNAAVADIELINVPASWSYVSLGSVGQKITDGEHTTPTRAQSGFYLLSARNVLNGSIVLNDVDYVGKAEFERLRTRCDPDEGDILISCSGSVGRVALVDKSNAYVMVRSAAMVRPMREFVDNRYLMYALQSPWCQKQMKDRSKSTAQANLFLGEIKQIVVPYPGLPEQREIVRRVEALFAYADRLESRYEKSCELTDDLTPALLAKAFRGELVSQDPNDKPATELLKRLAMQRSGDGKATKAARSKRAASVALSEGDPTSVE